MKERPWGQSGLKRHRWDWAFPALLGLSVAAYNYDFVNRIFSFLSIALLLFLLIRWVIRNWRAPRVPGMCSKCGYDLRATPDRCPECGTVPSHS